ncbi:Slp family lipoprotein [Shigella sonnei]
MLSGCVTVPDAMQGSSPTPQQDLVRVMSAPQLYVGQEARFGGKAVAGQTSKGKHAWKWLPYHWTAQPDRRWETSRGRIYADVNGFLDPWISADNW